MGSKDVNNFLTSKRYAVVTGGNKGIGFEICRQLASNGIVVVLTARDEKRGLEAVEKIKESGIADDNIIFHQLDVTNPASVSSLADFIRAQFGKLDILVNNAGTGGLIIDSDKLASAVERANGSWPLHGEHVDWNEISTTTFEMAKEGLNTNYYGAKRMVEALVPLLQLSDSPRIVNVTSLMGLLMNIPSETVKLELSNVESLTEEKVDKLLNKFLDDMKEGSLEKEGWPTYLSSYTISKAAMNAYTRILANKYPSFLVNCVCPGFVKTDITCNSGGATPVEGAKSPVRLAMLAHGGPSGLFFSRDQVSCF